MAQNLQERIPFIPPAEAPNDYTPPFQSRFNVKNLEYCVPIPIGTGKPFDYTSLVSLPFNHVAVPLEYFKLFFTEAILLSIVEAINTYA